MSTAPPISFGSRRRVERVCEDVELLNSIPAARSRLARLLHTSAGGTLHDLTGPYFRIQWQAENDQTSWAPMLHGLN